MREKLETLPLAQLRELAKSQGIRNVSSLRKSELIDRLCAISEQEGEKKEEEQTQAHTQRAGNGEGAQAHTQRVGNGEAAQTHSSAGSAPEPRSELQELDSGIEANGILEVMPDGFGFIRCENFLPGENAPSFLAILPVPGGGFSFRTRWLIMDKTVWGFHPKEELS